MGLDMYFRGKKYKTFKAPEVIEDGFPIKEIILDLGYFRKHPDLHGFIVENFADGKDECQDIELEAKDLRKILEAAKSRDLPKTTGFFFGDSTDEDIEETVALMPRLIEWLETPDEHHYRSVVYRASW